MTDNRKYYERQRDTPEKLEKFRADRRAAHRRRLAEDPTYKHKHAASNLKWRNTPEGWARSILASIRSRAKSFGLDFDLSINDLVIPTHCPVLGIPLRVATGRCGPADDSPSVDRFDNSKGYVRSNIRIISFKANSIKRDASADEVALVLAYMRGEQ